ncbi:MAG: ribose-phosphate diphosphokinase [Candidatus Bathyarchaeota archaeon]|nr:ribose-phosphate diphosphokinase [Candidatus Bathyarchaeota archaeon]
MIVIPGPASVELGKAVAKKLGLEAYPVEHKIFSDGESKIRITVPVKDEHVVLVQTTAPDPDRKFMQLLMMARTAKDFGAERVTALVPYLAYARQDKRFLEGEALTFDVALTLLESVGIDDLVVVDIHNEEVTKELQSSHRIKVHPVSAIPAIATYLKENGYDGAYSLSPDIGRKDIVSKASKIMGGGFAFFEKVRDLHTGKTTMIIKELEMKGKKAVVFDDIISSGGTMARAIKGLKDQGADLVAAVCTHALFMPGAEKKLKAAGTDLILTADTVETSYSKVSIAGLLADTVKQL